MQDVKRGTLYSYSDLAVCQTGSGTLVTFSTYAVTHACPCSGCTHEGLSLSGEAARVSTGFRALFRSRVLLPGPCGGGC